jgi:hypothetical protein
MRKLTVKSGPAAGRSMPIEADLVIGRADADLTIDDTELSRRHVLLRPVDGGVEVQDLGSTNGTVVNGTRISEPVTVSTGASIELGDTRIAVEVEPDGPPAPARQRPPRALLIAIAAAFVVVVVAAIAVLAGGGSDEAEARTFDARVSAPSLARPESFQVAGVLTGDPLGEAAVVVQRRLGGNLQPGGPPASVRGFFLVTSSDGELSLNFEGELSLDREGRETLDARGTASNGTGDYAEVTGSFRLTGGRSDADARVAEYALDGELDY